MKNLLRSIVFVAAAAMTLASCSKDPVTDNQPAPGQRTLRFTSSEGAEDNSAHKIGTRTHFDDQYAVKWDDATDQVGVYIHDTELLGGTSNAVGTIERVGTVAHFTAQVGSFYANDFFCAYYPYTADNNSGAGSVKMTIPAQQEQAETGTFNGRNNPMVAVPHPFTEEEAATGTIKLPVKFRLLGGIAEFAIYSANAAYNGEVIRSLTFTNSTQEFVTGTFTYDLTAVTETGETAAIDKSTILAGEGSNSVSVTLDQEWASAFPVSADQADNILFLTVLPGEYTGNFVVTTDKASYTFSNKTVDFKRAHIRRFSLDLNNAERSECITGAYTWELASGDLSINGDTPKATATTGTPAMLWNLAFTNPYFFFNADRGVQIGSGAKQATASLSTDVYGDEIKSIVVNSSVASDGQATLAVYLDNKLLNSFEVTNTSALDYTFTPATPVKAGNIRISMAAGVMKAMYLKSVTILSANTVTTPLSTPALTVEGTTVNWEAVPNAAGYQYTLDGGQTAVDVSGTSIDCSTWEPATYSVQAKAISGNPLYSDSEWSTAASVTIENTATGGRYVKIESNLDDWTGKYLITFVKDKTVNILSGQSSDYGTYENISSKLQADGSIISDQSTDQYACTVEKTASGYSILFGDKYIGGAAKGKLYFDNTFSASRDEWIFSESNKIQSVFNTKMQIQWNSSSPRFACYEGTQAAITLYQLEDKTPRIIVDGQYSQITFAADVLSGTVPFKSKNLTGDVTATVTDAAGNWFTATADNANGKVDWTATANSDAAPRTATLTLSADGAEPVVLTVTQLAPPQQLGKVTLNTPVVDGLKITVSWNAVENASGYAWRIVTTAAPDTDVQTGITESTATSADIAGLDPATEYTVYVKATGDGVHFLDSEEASVTASTQTATVLVSPTLNPPTVDGKKITVSWAAVENASGYAWRIVKTAEPATDVQSGTIPGATTSADITGLDPTTEYTIYVKATGDDVNFADSPEASVNATTGESAVVAPVTLNFSFTSNPGGWPTAASAAKSVDYTLDGTTYPWTIYQAYYHTNQKTLWFLKSKNGYATLPAIAGMKITKVEFKKNSGGTKTAKVSLKLDGTEIASSNSSTTASLDVTDATSSSVITICNDTSSNFGLDSITITYEGE